MKEAKTIHDTPVVPYLIAERAVWNVLEEKKRHLLPMECARIVEALCPQLVERAEQVYLNNGHFRKQMNSRNIDQRYYLEMFMEHWTLPLLTQ